MKVYYNEIDKKCCAWIKELMAKGIISKGDIDDRSIEQVTPSDVAGYDRAHFFAGIAVWDYVLNKAGWPDDRPVWTGSCPCQPFSAAGKRGGDADERHLWPAWFRLIKECRPTVVFGEQVSSKDSIEWYTNVKKDLNSIGYAVVASDTPACAFGAPHIRQRLYFVGERG